MEHMQSVLHKLALFHAASATRVATRGDYAPKYQRGKYVEVVKRMSDDLYKNVMKILMNSLATYEGHEAYIDSLRKYSEHAVDEMWLKANSHADEFNVLKHGDCWTNNLMFQYDDDDDDNNTVKDMYFVDLQVPHYGSPAEDLWYLIISSAQLDIKLLQFDHFVRFYHENLCKYLQVLKYPHKVPSLEELHKDLHDNAVYGYTAMIFVMGAALLPQSNESKFENFVSESENANRFQNLMYTNERYRQHAAQILPWLHKRGVFSME